MARTDRLPDTHVEVLAELVRQEQAGAKSPYVISGRSNDPNTNTYAYGRLNLMRDRGLLEISYGHSGVRIARMTHKGRVAYQRHIETTSGDPE